MKKYIYTLLMLIISSSVFAGPEIISRLGLTIDSTEITDSTILGRHVKAKTIKVNHLDPAGTPNGYIPKVSAGAFILAPESSNVNPTINGDIFLYGDLRYQGHGNNWDMTNLYAQNAPAYLRIQIPNQYISTANDSFNTVHGSILYIPGGLYGWNRWMIMTKGSDTHEDPFLRVSNDGINWNKFIVGTDTCPDPLADSTMCVINSNDTAAHLSDPDLLVGSDGKLWAVFRANYAGVNEEEVLWVTSSSNGLTWTPPESILSLSDAPDLYLGKLISPAWWVDTLGTYKMVTIEAATSAPAINRAMLFGAPYPNGPWSLVDTVRDSTGVIWKDTSHMQVNGVGKNAWHIDVIPKGADEKIIIMSSRDIAGGPSFYLHAGKTKNNGRIFSMNKNPILIGIGSNLGWDGEDIYRSTGCWFDDGKQTYMELYYSARGSDTSTTNPFRIGRTLLYNTASWVSYDLSVVHGHNGPPGDSVTLKFPHHVGDTLWWLVDSTNIISADDTIRYSGRITDALHTLDSIIVGYQTTGKIDSIALYGPTRSTGLNMADSLWYGDGTDRTSTSTARISYYVNEKNILQGDRFAVKMFCTLADDNDIVRVAYVELKGRKKW